jgi:hypothetical protein
MAGITTYISILTMNVNELNPHIKRYHFANWIDKEDPAIIVYKRPILLTVINTGLG